MDLTDSASRLHVSASTSMGLELGAELISEILMDLGKVVDNFVNDESTDTGHTCSNVLYQTVTMSLIKNLEPELSWLTEVVLLSRIESVDVSGHRPLAFSSVAILLGAIEAVRVVVRGLSLAVIAHCSGSLNVVRTRAEGAVDRELNVVGSKTVIMGVGVGEETALEHLVRREFNTGNDVCRAESGLLDLKFFGERQRDRDKLIPRQSSSWDCD